MSAMCCSFEESTLLIGYMPDGTAFVFGTTNCYSSLSNTCSLGYLAQTWKRRPENRKSFDLGVTHYKTDRPNFSKFAYMIF